VGPGHEKYVTGAIESVVGQSFRNWEIVLANDTGTPLNFEQFPFIKEIYCGKNGAGHARNRGVEAATGTFVLFLDADDYLDPNAIKNMLQTFVDTQGDRYIYGDYCVVDGNHIREIQTADYDPMIFLNDPSLGNGVTVLMPKEWFLKVGGFDEAMPTFEDVDFFSRCAIIGLWGQRTPVVTFYYRLNTGSRRPNEKEREKYHQIVVENNKDYITGVKKMGSCCGGKNSTFLMEAKRMLNPDADWPQKPVIEGDGLVRMQFIGETIGAISYTVHGHTYRGGNNAIDRYANALPADVEALEMTGKWQRVASHVVAQTPAEIKVSEPVPVPVKSDAELQVEAAAKLEAAKAEFAAQEPEPVIEKAPAVTRQATHEVNKRGRKKNA